MSRAVAAAAGVFLVAFGVWAFAAPQSFYDTIATYPPFNKHLFHDIGAFQIGLGATLLLALVWRDSLKAALAGNAAAAVMHALSHVIDRHMGGRAIDPFFFGLIAAAFIAAVALRRRES